MTRQYRTLVLNNNFLPISVFPDLYTISGEDAILRSLNGSCNVIYTYDKKILTPSRTDLYWPSVIVNFNNKGFRNEIKLKKSSLFYRDHCICAYCERELKIQELTYDHVLPKHKGGKHHWENVVAACSACNMSKGNKMPQGKWKPKKTPFTPSFFDILEIRKKYPLYVHDPAWIQFLPKWAGEIIVREQK